MVENPNRILKSAKMINITNTLMPSAYLSSATNPSSVPFVENGYASTDFLIICSALVFLMTPGVGLLYSGLSNHKNALTLMMCCMISYVVVTIQWIVFGYSIAFSESSTSLYFGNLEFAGLARLGSQSLPLTAPSQSFVTLDVPAIVFCLFQLQFAAVTVAIIFGAANERVRLLPAIIFMFVWTT